MIYIGGADRKKERQMLNELFKNNMSCMFSTQRVMDMWLYVELAILRAKAGRNSDNVELLRACHLLEKIKHVDVGRALEIEKTTRHEIAAFVRTVREQMSDLAETAADKNLGRLIHQGVTSHDVEDTAQSMILATAGHSIEHNLYKLARAAQRKAMMFKYAPCNGYTHNQVAEPVTIGKRFLDFELAIRRQLQKFHAEVFNINQCKIKGSVGIYSGNLDPAFEKDVAFLLKMQPAPTATQILSIENLVQFFNPLTVIACVVENFSQNLRLASGDLAEIREGVADGQIASTTMAFKENPVNLESVTGAARKIKALYSELTNASGTWREFDTSNSFQIQRHIIPEIFETAQHIADTATDILENLNVFPIQAMRNIDKYGDFIFAGAAKDYLANNAPLSNGAAGNISAEIYEIIQKKSSEAKHAADFRGQKSSLFEALAGDRKFKKNQLLLDGLKTVMSLPYNLRNVAGYYNLACGGEIEGEESDIHDKLVDYIIGSDQLQQFDESDAVKFIDMYEQIVLANYENKNHPANEERTALTAAVDKFRTAMIKN